MVYLSGKTLGAFSNWLADMKVGHAGRNPAIRIAKMELGPDPPGGHHTLGRRSRLAKEGSLEPYLKALSVTLLLPRHTDFGIRRQRPKFMDKPARHSISRTETAAHGGTCLVCKLPGDFGKGRNHQNVSRPRDCHVE